MKIIAENHCYQIVQAGGTTFQMRVRTIGRDCGPVTGEPGPPVRIAGDVLSGTCHYPDSAYDAVRGQHVTLRLHDIDWEEIPDPATAVTGVTTSC